MEVMVDMSYDPGSKLHKLWKQQQRKTKLLISLSVVGLVLFIGVASAFPLKEAVFSLLFPKPLSLAAQRFGNSEVSPYPLDFGIISQSQPVITKELVITNLGSTPSALPTPDWGYSHKEGRALSFNGQDTYVDLGTPPGLEALLVSDFTISLWINPTSKALQNSVILARGDSFSSQQNKFILIYLDQGKLTASLRGDNGEKNSTSVSSQTNIPPNTWTHLTLVRKRGTSLGMVRQNTPPSLSAGRAVLSATTSASPSAALGIGPSATITPSLISSPLPTLSPSPSPTSPPPAGSPREAGGSTSELVLYINGQEEGRVKDNSGTITFLREKGQRPLSLGSAFLGSSQNTPSYQGLMDDLLIFKKALTPQEITSLSNPSLPTSLPDSLTSSLLGYFKFDDPSTSSGQAGQGKVVYDSSSYGNQGQIKGGSSVTAFADGRLTIPTPITFNSNSTSNSTSPYLKMDSHPALDKILTDSFTISGWAKYQGSGNKILVGKGDTYAGEQNKFILIYLDQGGKLTASLRGDNGEKNTTSIFGKTPIKAGEWFHYSLVRQKNVSLTLYLNGVADSDSIPDQAGDLTFTKDRPLTLGAANVGSSTGATSSLFQGLMDDIRVYNLAFTLNQIKDLYQQKVTLSNQSPPAGGLPSTPNLPYPQPLPPTPSTYTLALKTPTSTPTPTLGYTLDISPAIFTLPPTQQKTITLTLKIDPQTLKEGAYSNEITLNIDNISYSIPSSFNYSLNLLERIGGLGERLAWQQGKPSSSGTIEVMDEKELKVPHVPGEILVKFKPEVKLQEEKENQTISSLSIETTKQERVLTPALAEIDKKYKIQKIEKVFKGTLPQKIKSIEEGSRRDLSNIYKIKLENVENIDELIQTFSSDPNVLEVTPNYIYHISRFPQDTFFDRQWYLNQDNDHDIDAPEGWDVDTGSAQVAVGVIDTGIDFRHPDLQNKVFNNQEEIGTDSQGRDKKSNGVDDDGNGFIDDWQGWDFTDCKQRDRSFNCIAPKDPDNDPSDDNGHGTHVSGIIAASTNNNQGVSGISWKSPILPVKVCESSGACTCESIVQGITYASHLAQVINMSFGGYNACAGEREAIEQASRSGAVTVAAAGNNNISSPLYPAFYSQVISVAALDQEDRKASFSNYGDWVDIAAPGVSILSTVPVGSARNGPYGSRDYEAWSGTSMATPVISGVAALVKSKYPSLDSESIRRITLLSADNINSTNNQFRGRLGSGRVNAQRALTSSVFSQITSPNSIYVWNQPKIEVKGTAWAINRSGFSYTLDYSADGQNWLNAGISYPGNTNQNPVIDSTLGSWDTSSLGNGTYTLRLRVISADQGSESLVRVDFNREAPGLRRGWPQITGFGPVVGPNISFYGDIAFSSQLSKNTDSKVIGTYLNEDLWTSDGQKMPGWSSRELAGKFIVSIFQMPVDRDNDGEIEILVYMKEMNQQNIYEYIDHLYWFDRSGRLLSHRTFPPTRQLEGINPHALSVADLDGDNIPEIVIVSRKWEYRWDAARRIFLPYPAATQIMVFKANLTSVAEKTIDEFSPSIPYGKQSLALGDVDSDGRKEIFVGLRGNFWATYPVTSRVYAFRYVDQNLIGLTNEDGIFVEDRFQDGRGSFYDKFLALGDLDGDGYREVIMVADVNGANVIRVFDGNGSLRWQKAVGANIGIPALGDFDKDRRPEIVFSDTVVKREGSKYGWYGQVKAYKSDGSGYLSEDGVIVDKYLADFDPDRWEPYFYPGATALGDVNGNGDIDILTTWLNSNELHAFSSRDDNGDGRVGPLNGWPIRVEGYISYFATIGGDVDGLGNTGIITLGYTDDSSVYLFNSRGRPTPNNMPWPMPHHDEQLTGDYHSTSVIRGTTLALVIGIPGIGGGQGENRNPVNATRSATVSLLNNNKQVVKTFQTNLRFREEDGRYAFYGTTELRGIASGSYYISVKLPNSLSKLLSETPINISLGESIVTSPVVMVMGDITNDNRLNILDWNQIIACIGSISSSANWSECSKADFNDDGRVNDQDRTLYGGLPIELGPIGRAVSFDGSSFVRIPENGSLSLTRDLTIEGWINITRDGGDFGDVFHRLSLEGGAFRSSIEMFINVNSRFNKADLRFGVSGRGVVSQVIIPLGSWTHVAGVKEGRILKSFINGIEVDRMTLESDNIIEGSDISTTIGGWLVNGYRLYNFNGLIDDLRISNIARDVETNWSDGRYFFPLEVDANTVTLWRFDNNLTDSSRNNNHGIADGNISYTDGKVPLPVVIPLSLKLQGIGTGTGENSNPLRRDRRVTVKVLDNGRSQVASSSATLRFDGNNFVGRADLGSIGVGFTSPSYYVTAKVDNSLSKLLNNGQPISITPGIPIATQSATLIMGDLNNDNVINISDFGQLRQCFFKNTSSPEWNTCQTSDFNDDGKISVTDYSRLLTNFLQRGE